MVNVAYKRFDTSQPQTLMNQLTHPDRQQTQQKTRGTPVYTQIKRHPPNPAKRNGEARRAHVNGAKHTNVWYKTSSDIFSMDATKNQSLRKTYQIVK